MISAVCSWHVLPTPVFDDWKILIMCWKSKISEHVQESLIPDTHEPLVARFGLVESVALHSTRL